jgi:hypothetical protein
LFVLFSGSVTSPRLRSSADFIRILPDVVFSRDRESVAAVADFLHPVGYRAARGTATSRTT